MPAYVARLSFQLPFELKAEGGWTVASCPPLDVHSQGRTDEEAQANLREALQVFIETCLETGTLDAVLKQAGFLKVHAAVAPVPASGPRLLDVPVELLANAHGQDRAH